MVETSMKEDYTDPVKRSLGLSSIYQQDATVGEAIETLADKIDDLEASIQSSLVFDIPVNVELDGEAGNQLAEIHSVLSAIRPYDVDMIIQLLRSTAKSGDT